MKLPLLQRAAAAAFFCLVISAGAAQAADVPPDPLQSAFEDLEARPPAALSQKVDAAIETGWKEDPELVQFLELWKEEAGTAHAADIEKFFSAPIKDPEHDVRVRFASLQNMARILLLNGRRHEAAGRFSDALKEDLLVLRIARNAGDDRRLLSVLVGVRLRSMAFAPVKALAGSGKLSDAERASLDAAIKEAAGRMAPEALARAMRDEKEISAAIVRRAVAEEAANMRAKPEDEFFARISERSQKLLDECFGRLESAAAKESVEDAQALEREIDSRVKGGKIGAEDFQNVEALKNRYSKAPDQLKEDLVEGVAIRFVQVAIPNLGQAIKMTADARSKYQALLVPAS